MVLKKCKNVFIDCGTNLGQGFEHFDKKYNFDSSWEIILFEPNPWLFNHIKKEVIEANKHLNISAYPIAICEANALPEVEFLMQNIPEYDAPIGGGSTVVSSDILHDEETEGYEKCIVKTVKLSTIIRGIGEPYMRINPEGLGHLAKNECKIVVKLDIEGEEYDVIEDLLNTSVAWWIHSLHVEFHGRRFKEDKRADEVRLIGELFQCGVVCFPHH